MTAVVPVGAAVALCCVDFSRLDPAEARRVHEGVKAYPGVLCDLPRTAGLTLSAERDNSAAESAFGITFSGSAGEVLRACVGALDPVLPGGNLVGQWFEPEA